MHPFSWSDIFALIVLVGMAIYAIKTQPRMTEEERQRHSRRGW